MAFERNYKKTWVSRETIKNAGFKRRYKNTGFERNYKKRGF